MQPFNPKSKRSILAWCFYDWANSSFSTIITTFVFAAYFTSAIAKNKIIGTAHWGDTMAIAGLIVAFLSPIFGAIADHQGRRKPWLAFFTLLTIICSALLWYAKPGENYILWTLTFVGLGTIGMEIATVFYNSMLSEIAPVKYIGRISGWSWAMGYLGGLLSLVIALVFFVQEKFTLFPLDHSSAEQIRICGILVAVWLFIFSLPVFLITPDKPSTGLRLSESIKLGILTLINTFRKLKHYKNIMYFLISRMFYIDALNTLFAFGGIYAAGTFGMSFSEILEFGIAMNVSAGIGAFSFAWLDDHIGSKPTMLISIAAMFVTGTILLFIKGKLLFWIFALIFGLFVGPVQAASRSLLVHIADEEVMTEMFGLFALAGRATAFLGPWLLALTTLHFNSQRIGMSVIMIFLAIGGLTLLMVKAKKT